MIDVETDVFDFVYPFVEPLVPADCFRSVYVPEAPALPFATLYEVDNATTQRRQSTADEEEAATLVYEANAYATEKYQCRDILNAIDGAMRQLNFRRTMTQPVPNLADSRLFRLTARYIAVADSNKTLYRPN